MSRYLLICLLIIPQFAAGSIYTYSYVGNSFTEVSGSGGPTTANIITVSFQLEGPLPPNLTPWNSGNVDPFILSWSMSDGATFLSSQNPNNSFTLGMDTDQFGNIVRWLGQGFGPNSSPWMETAFPAGSAPIDLSVTWGNGHSFAASADARNSGAPGTWSVSEIPEPAAWKIVAFTLTMMSPLRNLTALLKARLRGDNLATV